jgi:hypothetical protein
MWNGTVRRTEAFDLIVSADTLVYFGDLKGVIAALAGALRPNGLVMFTLEQAVGNSAGVDYRLELHGRYSHDQVYLERLLTLSGLQSKIIHADLRTEAGAPVRGLVCFGPSLTTRASGVRMRNGFSTTRPLTYECPLMPTYSAVITSWVTPPPINRTDSNESVIQGPKTANPSNELA